MSSFSLYLYFHPWPSNKQGNRFISRNTFLNNTVIDCNEEAWRSCDFVLEQKSVSYVDHFCERVNLRGIIYSQRLIRHERPRLFCRHFHVDISQIISIWSSQEEFDALKCSRVVTSVIIFTRRSCADLKLKAKAHTFINHSSCCAATMFESINVCKRESRSK